MAGPKESGIPVNQFGRKKPLRDDPPPDHRDRPGGCREAGRAERGLRTARPTGPPGSVEEGNPTSRDGPGRGDPRRCCASRRSHGSGSGPVPSAASIPAGPSPSMSRTKVFQWGRKPPPGSTISSTNPGQRGISPRKPGEVGRGGRRPQRWRVLRLCHDRRRQLLRRSSVMGNSRVTRAGSTDRGPGVWPDLKNLAIRRLSASYAFTGNLS